MTQKKKIAVFFGGRSPEHDVSVISALQALAAIDTRRYDPFPVYIAPDGEWFVGDALREQKNYLLSGTQKKSLTSVMPDIKPQAGGRGALLPRKRSLLGGGKPVLFDAAIPAFHGLIGEDGPFQGLMETADIPYSCMRLKATALFMDKAATKLAFAGAGLPMLPFVTVDKPAEGTLVNEDALARALEPLGFPCCVKPAHLGSSIGVGKAGDAAEARAILSALFQYDSKAIVEPFVPHLTEYNISVRRGPDGRVQTSAIERPKSSSELLDFREKYVAKDGKTGGKKSPGQGSEGMLSLTREINPDIPAAMDADIRRWAEIIFTRYDGTGAPRIDFIANGRSGEIWFNELNPCPGSFAYFLWEARRDGPVLFTELLTDLIEESFLAHARVRLPVDPVPQEARLFPRR